VTPLQFHWLFETLAYIVGFRLYLWQRRRRGDVVSDSTRWSVIAAAIAGAALGSKLLYWLEDPALTWQHRADVAFLLAGKTVVGGLVGGLIGVELTKLAFGVRQRTGDLFALPLAIGIAIGRIGCFLAGLPDRTYGTPTNLPWAVDFGDGIPRHPTQLYEVIVLIALAVWLARAERRPHANGDLFKQFMVGYLGLRVVVDFLKPGVALFAGLTAIQWTALLTLLYYSRGFVQEHRWSRDSLSQAGNKP
jgi:phosphatidylglycerol---prolipoprotein diacylglyceryl transferase